MAAATATIPLFSDTMRQHHESMYQRPLPQTLPPLSVHGRYTMSLPLPTARQESLPRSPMTPSASSAASDDWIRPSLPSISNLLVIADGDRSSRLRASQQSMSPRETWQCQFPPRTFRPEHHRQSSYAANSPPCHTRAEGPIAQSRHDSAHEQGAPSPSMTSAGSSVNGPPYFITASGRHAEAHGQHMARSQLPKCPSPSSQSDVSRHGSPSYNHSPSYSTSPSTTSAHSSYSTSSLPQPNLHQEPHQESQQQQQQQQQPQQQQQQRALPPPFSPTIPQQMHGHPRADVKGSPWEHHHYISSSASTTYPSTQDRYQCLTCKKAFSRPSSLKIHSHSHTGEKPFRCPHGGCAKSFSVRSNMKRHERGCHSGGGNLVAQVALLA